MSIEDINFQLIINGQTANSYIISYDRVRRLCGGVGMITIVLEWTNPLSFTLYDPVLLYEDGIKKGTYVVGDITKNADTFTYEVVCYDPAKKLNDYFIEDVYSVTYLSTAKYWIMKFMDEVGVDYNFTTAYAGTYISENTEMGTRTAWEQIMQLVQQNGWHLFFDAEGVAQIGITDLDSENFEEVIYDTSIIDLKQEVSDTNYRNKAVVWGNASPVTDRWVFASADWHGWGQNEYNESDIRAVVLANGDIPTVTDAQVIAGQMVKAFAKIDNVITITLHGAWDLDLAQRIYIHSTRYTGGATITTVSSKLSSTGWVTELICNERCPRLFAFWGYNGYVYVGTSGNGIWRKPLKYSETWVDYSAGITDLYIKDLIIQNGVYGSTTKYGHLYVRETIDAYWRRVLPSLTDESDGTVYSSGELLCVGCTIDKITNEVIAGFNLNNEELLRSWIVKVNPGGYTTSKYQVKLLDELAAEENPEFVYDFNIYDLDNAGLSNFIVASGNAGTVFKKENASYYWYSPRNYYEGTCDASPVFEGDYELEFLTDFSDIGVNTELLDICYTNNYVYAFTESQVAQYNVKTREYSVLSFSISNPIYFGAKDNQTAFVGGYSSDWTSILVYKLDFRFGTSTLVLSTSSGGNGTSVYPRIGGILGDWFVVGNLIEDGEDGSPAHVRCTKVNVYSDATYSQTLVFPTSFHGKITSGEANFDFYTYGDYPLAAHINERYMVGIIFPGYNIIYDEIEETWSKFGIPHLIIFDSLSGSFSIDGSIAESILAELNGDPENFGNVSEIHGSYLSGESQGNTFYLDLDYYDPYPTTQKKMLARCSVHTQNPMTASSRTTIYYGIAPHVGLDRGYFTVNGLLTEGLGYYSPKSNTLVYMQSESHGQTRYYRRTTAGESQKEGAWLDDTGKITVEDTSGRILYQCPLGFNYAGANSLSLSGIPATIPSYEYVPTDPGDWDYWLVGNNEIVVVRKYGASASGPWNGAIYRYKGTEPIKGQNQLLVETNGFFAKVSNIAWKFNIDISNFTPIIVFGGYFIPGEGTWGDPSYSAGAIYISPDGSPGSFSSIVVEGAPDYIADARSYSIFDSEGNYKRYVLFPQSLNDDHSESVLSSFDVSDLPKSSRIYTVEEGLASTGITTLLEIAGFGSKVETSNYDDNPFMFVSVEAALGGGMEHFYQKDAHRFYETPTAFVDRKGDLDPDYVITVIRVDDLL